MKTKTFEFTEEEIDALVDSLKMNIEGCRIDEQENGPYIELMSNLANQLVSIEHPLRKMAEEIADEIQAELVNLNGGEPMDGDQVEEFFMMLQQEINKLMGNV